MTVQIGSVVRVKDVNAEDAIVAVHLVTFQGKTGVVKSLSVADDSLWVEFPNGKGGIFYPEELELVKEQKKRKYKMSKSKVKKRIEKKISYLKIKYHLWVSARWLTKDDKLEKKRWKLMKKAKKHSNRATELIREHERKYGNIQE